MSKVIKTVVIIILAFIVIVLIYPECFASENDTYETSEDTSTYFSDVKTTDWFYEYVKYMYDNKIILGFEDGTFRPNTSVTYAQVVALLCRIGEVDVNGYGLRSNKWYSAYSEWFEVNIGIYPLNLDYEQPIKRSEMCNYIAKFYRLELPENEKEQILKTIKPFDDENTEISTLLYLHNILYGSLENGKLIFDGESYLRYSEVSAFLYRLITSDIDCIDYSNTYIAIENKAIYENLNFNHYESGINANPQTEAEIIDTIGYMMFRGYNTFTVEFEAESKDNYINVNDITKYTDKIENIIHLAKLKYREFSEYYKDYEIYTSIDGDKLIVKVEFPDDNEEETRKYKIDTFKYYCEINVFDMILNNKINDTMSNKDKAKKIFEWICYNMEYDTSYVSNTGFDAAINRKSTCVGYVSIYDYMCNLLGINTEAVRGIIINPEKHGIDITKNENLVNHSWSRIIDASGYHYCDITWGDPIPDYPNYCDLDWFWLDEEELRDHELDPECYLY